MSPFDRADAALAAAAKSRAIAGAIAIVTDRDKTLFEAVYGVRDIASGEALRQDSIFRIASMTKAIAGAAAMKLVEQGKLDLDAPIGNVLPQLAKPKVLDGFESDGTPRLRDAKRAITLRHLLTHTAGFAYEVWNADQKRYIEAVGLPSPLTRQPRSLEVPLMSDPGTRWEYGINIDWVGKAVEAVSGKSLGTYMKDEFFDPLGMSDTSYNLSPEQHARIVTLYLRHEDGSLHPQPTEVHRTDNNELGGGGLYGTARDYIAFVRMILNGGRANGRQILKPETIALMAQNHIGELTMGKMTTAAPRLSNDVDLHPEQDKKWGLSFLVNTKETKHGRKPGSLFWAGLANTYYWIDPASGVGGVLFTQLRPFADPIVLDLLGTIERATYDAIT
ncbi:esterase EstB [Variibacter gotjawalensis]|uniref:Esterase EstB n=1 Tax=Variibacter gotjawalensis TaxID=1333996 RepID=A0A0S3PWP2_9BRAD|nr:serine hydrolase domain-containing protein [Variibacter gotjawalensis]NIK46133.1 CubicO group peptidase (beta-lactamase class C family) [Variibacter gotjawalensis]RZS48051.1 CubicO group peptidase (beta-lactamase class C family) [Variibacter gotjawalensis]BAT60307.1 esterase EstB [Variibacter gotjawalensis]